MLFFFLFNHEDASTGTVIIFYVDCSDISAVFNTGVAVLTVLKVEVGGVDDQSIRSFCLLFPGSYSPLFRSVSVSTVSLSGVEVFSVLLSVHDGVEEVAWRLLLTSAELLNVDERVDIEDDADELEGTKLLTSLQLASLIQTSLLASLNTYDSARLGYSSLDSTSCIVSTIGCTLILIPFPILMRQSEDDLFGLVEPLELLFVPSLLHPEFQVPLTPAPKSDVKLPSTCELLEIFHRVLRDAYSVGVTTTCKPLTMVFEGCGVAPVIVSITFC